MNRVETAPSAEAGACARPPKGDLVFDLVRTLKLLHRLRDRSPRVADGLETAAQPILYRLVHGDGLRVSDIAAVQHTDVSTASRTAASLVSAGLAIKTTDPTDRRAQVLHATDAGRAAVASLNAQRTDTLARILADWTPDDISTFHAFIARFAADVERDLDAPASL